MEAGYDRMTICATVSHKPANLAVCSSVGRATVINTMGHGFEPHRGQKLFLFLPVGRFPFQDCRSGIVWDVYTALRFTTLN